MIQWVNKIADVSVPLFIDGRIMNVSSNKLSELIKDKLVQSKSLMALFKEFEVDPNRLKDLRIEIADLKDKYAEADAQVLRLNFSLFENGNFFEDFFFVVAHEIVHWLSRVREQDAYFNDPEEVLGFVASIAYELEQGRDLDSIWNKIYPKISFHFHDEHDARQFFSNMLVKAKKMAAKSV